MRDVKEKKSAGENKNRTGFDRCGSLSVFLNIDFFAIALCFFENFV